MSTNSHIGKVLENGMIIANYCHSDGYVEHHAPILLECYNTEEKVDELIALGPLSILGREIGEQHDFNNRVKGWCLAFGRDRGDDNPNKSRITRTWDPLEFFDPGLAHIPYVYLFIGGEWYYFCRSESHCQADLLDEAMAHYREGP